MKTVLECGAHNGAPNRLECEPLLKSGLWRGILLEPYPPRFTLLRQRWPDHICLPIGLSDVECSSETFRTHRAVEGKNFFGQSMTWDVLCEANDYNVDFAIIDVEHMELKVLAGMTKRLPKRIMIEMHVLGIADALRAKGYVAGLKVGVNQHWELKC